MSKHTFVLFGTIMTGLIVLALGLSLQSSVAPHDNASWLWNLLSTIISVTGLFISIYGPLVLATNRIRG